MPEHSRITFLLDVRLKEEFFRFCKARQQPASDVVRELMQQWIRGASAGDGIVPLKVVRSLGLQQAARSLPVHDRKVNRGSRPRSSGPSEP
ncbi:hypothetical protein ACPWT1_22525 [Ramlibacter sp. MMS24-I3-19]|uniref:hypothetical protein n=1 Tax=Ramlibacter sp. MMS24-I3-19 TaxID=3416606 RepID=UPI003D082BE1